LLSSLSEYCAAVGIDLDCTDWCVPEDEIGEESSADARE
jgi:hypothetical protein